MSERMILGIQERPKSGQWFVLSLQHVFAMFGATVLVPFITGLDIGVALVASGIGTLIYILLTKGKVPVYLGSSFAYIGAINAAKVIMPDNSVDFSAAYFGLMVVGMIYAIVAIVIRFTGNGWLKKLLPPVVVGPMIIVIGLYLAPIAIDNAGLNGGVTWEVPLVALITFTTVVISSVFLKGFFRIIPFLLAIIVGYVASIILGIVDISTISESYSFFQTPDFTFIGTYKFNLSAVLMFAPIAFVTIAEHIGDHTVLGEITGQDFLENPGLKNTLMGDGVATFVSAAIGGPANTTYGENTGVVALTGAGSVYVTGLAAIFAICLGFFGYVQGFISSIPTAVLGGMTIILYGLIAGNGVKVLIKAKVDISEMRNLIIIATMLVIGLGGASIAINSSSSLTGMSLAAMVGILLNILLPEKSN